MKTVVRDMRLKAMRESAGLTQRDLARLANISRSSISHVEAGRYPPTAPFAGKVCRVLSVLLGVELRTWDVFPERFEKVRGSVTIKKENA